MHSLTPNETLVGSVESLQPFPLFWRRHGVRLPMQLAAPRLFPMEQLDLPLGTIIHFIANDDSVFGISSDDYLLQGATRMVMVEHATTLTDNKGNPRSTMLSAGKMLREYHRRYRRTRVCLKRELALRDPRTVLVQNYALLSHLFRYPANYFRSYFKWYNIQATMWDRIAEIAEQTDRPQYIQLRMPTHLPTLQRLVQFETRGITRDNFKIFNEPEALALAELWKWLGKNRSDSVMGRVDAAKLKNVNLIFTEGDTWCAVNLGLLDEWRKSDENPKGVVPILNLQKRLLRIYMTLIDTRATEEELAPVKGQRLETVPSEEPTTAEAERNEQAEPEVVAKSDPVVLKIDSGEDKTLKLKLNQKIDWDRIEGLNIETDENQQLLDLAIDKDLEVLERLGERIESQRELVTDADGSVVIEPTDVITKDLVASYTPEERTLSSGVMDKVDSLADAGMVSGAEYRRFTAISTAYTKLPDPYGEDGKSLLDRTVIQPEDLKLEKTTLIEKADRVFDKSMLQSNVAEFNAQYVAKVMPADIVSSVLNLQRAGVAITGYKVEHKEDAFNAYEEHAVQLTPVQGKSSIIHFRLPKIEPDGTFKANGVRYRNRFQRSD